MEEQIISAIEIACDPRSSQAFRIQAFEFVNRLRQEPSLWQPCLNIFTQIPRQSDVVRVYALDIVNSAVQSGIIDQQGLGRVKDQFMTYLQNVYASDSTSGSPDSPSIENKLAQTLTVLFSALYESVWQTAFDDLLRLTTSAQSNSRDNLNGTVFYLRVINSIHDEIGDQLLSRSRSEQDRANVLKDLIRERDVQKIALSWQEILHQWPTSNALVAELCLKAVGKFVSWVDISLVVNQQVLELLFEQLKRAEKVDLTVGEERARGAVIDVFTETISKKMPAADKIELIALLNLEAVITQLAACPALSQRRFSSTYDTDLAETVAKLVDATTVDIVKVLESETQNSQVWQKAENMLHSFLPLVLRFFSDEYDEVCSTVINGVSNILAFLRRISQDSSSASRHAGMLLPILKAIFEKMKYDETASWDDNDVATDEAEFQDLRQRLGSLQQAIAAIDQQLYIDAISGLVDDTFDRLASAPAQLNWRDLELALHEMYLFGELAVKHGGLYQKNKPSSLAAERLVQMMVRMVESSTGSHVHPTVLLEYMEILVRYLSFFDKQTQYIKPVLENFLRLVHHHIMRVKVRGWYLFSRFVSHNRSHIGQVAEIVVQNISDLLVIEKFQTVDADVGDDDGSSTSREEYADTVFTAQLYLFEAAGCICGATSVAQDKQIELVEQIMQPLFTNIGHTIPLAASLEKEHILQLYNNIEALGTLAYGFSDWNPGQSGKASGNAPSALVRATFAQVADIILVALQSVKASGPIRRVSRFAFSRLIGVLGSRILEQLPQWIDGLLSGSSTRDDMASFLRLLDQLVYGFKTEISSFLDNLFTGLLQLVFNKLSATESGTDYDIQLAELKREYLSFLLVILNNDLASVIVSTTNQPLFETIIGTLEHFTKDTEDFPTAKMAFQVLSRMCSVWGGPDVVPAPGQTNGNATTPQPTLLRFDQFMITRFSLLCWAMPANPSFNAKDAQARQVLQEAASLQKTIYSKTGQEYVAWLREELKSMGMSDAMIGDYLQNLHTFEMKNWRTFFTKVVVQGGQM